MSYLINVFSFLFLPPFGLMCRVISLVSFSAFTGCLRFFDLVGEGQTSAILSTAGYKDHRHKAEMGLLVVKAQMEISCVCVFLWREIR